MRNRPTARPLIALLALVCCVYLLTLDVLSTRAQGGGIGEEGPQGEPLATIASMIEGVEISFGQEFGKTTIWMRVCANGPNFQLRSEAVGAWQTEVFHRTQAGGGCSPSTTSRWRMIYNAVAGPQIYRIYATANDAVLSEVDFMQRAARVDCLVTGYGTGTCAPSLRPPPFSAPAGSFEGPAPGATLVGSVVLSGWAVDAGAWNGSGVDQIEFHQGTTQRGAASYGQARPDVAAALGDARFTNSGFSYQLDTTKLTNGPTTLQIRYHSTISGQWTSMSRDVIVSNPTVATPVPQPVVPPVDPAMKYWNVPYISQGDPQWRRLKIGACDSTIRYVGCALTSLSMIFQFYGASHNPGTLNSCFGPDACLLKWSGPRLLPCSGGKVTWVGWPGFSYARLDQELERGPVILEINRGAKGQHFVVVLSGRGGDARNYLVNDPGLRQGVRQTLSSTLNYWGGRPASMRLYRGTPALAATDVTEATLSPLASPPLAVDETITGTVALYRYTETELVLELASRTTTGSAIEMRVWTTRNPSEIWQPFAEYVSVLLDDTYYVQFRDMAGNTTDVISESVPVAANIEESLTVYLPLLGR